MLLEGNVTHVKSAILEPAGIEHILGDSFRALFLVLVWFCHVPIVCVKSNIYFCFYCSSPVDNVMTGKSAVGILDACLGLLMGIRL